MTFDEYAGHAGPDRNAPDYKERLTLQYPPKAEFVPFEKSLDEAFGKQNNKTTMYTGSVKTLVHETLKIGDEMELGGITWRLTEIQDFDQDIDYQKPSGVGI